MSHFSFCKMSQCRPTFFIVKHKTVHNMQQKKIYFGTHREQYSTVNRVIPLFSQTIFTISVSCPAVKVCVLPPRCGSLPVLQNTNTAHCILLICSITYSYLQYSNYRQYVQAMRYNTNRQYSTQGK